jgi:hypothetical protein
LKRMEPSCISQTASGLSVMSLVSSSTSTIRSADARAIVIMTSTMESIMRLINICVA